MTWLRKWRQARRTRRSCWHHDTHTGETWVTSQLIDTGMRKMFWCTRCNRTVIV